MDSTNKKKEEEQYPLLKIHVDPANESRPTVVAPSVTWPAKRAWMSRWPEIISACWMTCILLGIFFLVFYVVGTNMYRRQTIFFIECNSSKPASDVFYHRIVQNANDVSYIFNQYAEYLASMAMEYPYLKFHVIFLVDDALQTMSGIGHSRIYSRFMAYPAIDFEKNTTPRVNDHVLKLIHEFQVIYPNINMTIVPLSKYMSMTPLKFKWRRIPVTYLTFYARVYSVYQYGGIAMDLNVFNTRFNSRHFKDQRIASILAQHNEGIHNNYLDVLEIIDNNEAQEVFSIFSNLLINIFNQTKTFFDVSVQLNDTDNVSYDKTTNEIEDTNKVKREILNLTNENNLNIEVRTYNENATEAETIVPTVFYIPEETTQVVMKINKSTSNKPMKNINKTENIFETPMMLHYNFLVITDDVGPSYPTPDKLVLENQAAKSLVTTRATADRRRKPLRLMAIDSNGAFISATTRQHPFLASLLSVRCPRMHPRFTIEDTLLLQCSGIFKDDLYCNSIYVL